MNGRRVLACAALTSLLALAGCSEEPESAGSSQAAAPGSGELPAPKPGSWRIEIAGGLVDWRSNRVPRETLLGALASRLHFEVVVDEPLEDTLSFSLRNASLPETIDTVLAGKVHRARWQYDWNERRHRLIAVAVGQDAQLESSSPFAAASASVDELDLERERIAVLRERTQQRAAALRSERLRPREDVDLEQLLAGLESPDPRERVRSALRIEPEGEGLYVLLEILSSDPDENVRSAAVSQLEDADTFAGVRGLLQALDDPERSVRLDAIEALEFAGDETVIPSLEPLLEHPDKEIRRAARDAVEFLRD